MLALEIHLQRQIRDRAARFQLCFYSIPGDAAIIGEKVRVGIAPVIVQVDGEEPIPIAGEAICVRMVEMFMPAVVAKAEAFGAQFRKDTVQVRDAVEIFDSHVDLLPLRAFHEPLDAAEPNLGDRRLRRKPRDVHDGGWNAVPAAIGEAGAERLQVGFPLEPAFPKRVRIAIGRMHIVNFEPKPPGQRRLTLLFQPVPIAPPERRCAKTSLPDEPQALLDGQG